jgi:hypothetical protein
MAASKTKDSKKAQSARFIEAAREAGASEDEAEFDRTLKRAVKPSPDLYGIVKGRAYALATTISGKTNGDAQQAGFEDVFDYIMSDSDHPRQASFLLALPDIMPEGHRKILLDGLAKEYAGLGGWMEYVDRETR